MAKLFPFRGGDTASSGEPRLVDIDDDAADEVFAALSSDTARAILSRLYESPETASGVAESADTSIQNARYHLEKLESAGLIEPVDTWYSSRGTEMTVYAPTNEPLVVAAGNQESKGVLRRALQRIVGGVGVLALASVAINRFAGRSGVPSGEPGGVDPADVAGTATDAGESPEAGQGGMTPAATDADGAPGEPAPDTEVQTPADATSPTDVPAEVTATIPPNTTGAPTSTPVETPTSTPTETPVETVTDATRTVGDGAAGSVLTAPPGVLFFAGGAVVIAVATAWWYWSRSRPMYGA